MHGSSASSEGACERSSVFTFFSSARAIGPDGFCSCLRTAATSVASSNTTGPSLGHDAGSLRLTTRAAALADGAADTAALGSSTLGVVGGGAEAEGAVAVAGFGSSQAARSIASVAAIARQTLASKGMAACYITAAPMTSPPRSPALRAARHLHHVRYEIRGPL